MTIALSYQQLVLGMAVVVFGPVNYLSVIHVGCTYVIAELSYTTHSNEKIVIHFVYIPPYHTNKAITWQELTSFLSNTTDHWCIIRDLNDITQDSEKMGGITFDL